MRPRVVLDADGVFVDFVGGFLDLVYNLTGQAFHEDQVTDWDICKAIGLKDDDARLCYGSVGQGFCTNLSPLPGALRGVKILESIADVYVVTSPWNKCETWVHEREKWIEKHLGIPHSRIMHGSAKYLVDADVLVDDRADTVVKWQETHPERIAVMWDRPWNRASGWTGYRMNDWSTLHKLVGSL